MRIGTQKSTNLFCPRPPPLPPSLSSCKASSKSSKLKVSRFSLETSYEKVTKGPRSAGGPGSGNPEPDGLFAIRNRTYSNLDDFSCLIHIYIYMDDFFPVTRMS